MGTPFEEFKHYYRERRNLHKALQRTSEAKELKEIAMDRGWCKRAGIESYYPDELVDALKVEMRENGYNTFFDGPASARIVKAGADLEKTKRHYWENAGNFVESWHRVWFSQGERWWFIQDVPTIYDDVVHLEDLPPRLRSKADAVLRLRRSQTQ